MISSAPIGGWGKKVTRVEAAIVPFRGLEYLLAPTEGGIGGKRGEVNDLWG